MKGVKNIGVGPCEVLGRLLSSTLSVHLLIDLSTIVFDMSPHSGHDRITSCGSSSNIVGGSRSFNEVEKVHPFRVVLNSEWEIVSIVFFHLLLHSDSSLVEAFSKDGGKKLPRVTTSIMISWVSSVKNSWNSSIIIVLIDFPFETESGVVSSDS